MNINSNKKLKKKTKNKVNYVLNNWSKYNQMLKVEKNYIVKNPQKGFNRNLTLERNNIVN